jgi:hypothetical protein
MGACTFARASGSKADLAESVSQGTLNNGEGSWRVVRGVLTFSASYATGGDSVPMASVGLQEVRQILVDPLVSPTNVNRSGLSVELTGTPGAPLVAAYETLNTEVANATNLSTRSVPVWFLGKG